MKKALLLSGAAALLLLSVLSVAKPARAASASLYLSPSSGTHIVGNRFSVTVRINTDTAVNAAQGAISFDSDILKVAGISTGGSIFNLWTTQPTFNNSAGSINFAGGIPHPGYKGNAGKICTITFQSKKTGAGGVRFTSGFALANDGKGTNILSSMGSGNYSISPKVEAPKQETRPAPSTPDRGGQPEPKKEEPVERAYYNAPKISSETHPDEDKWFSGKKAKFSWDMPDGVEGVSLTFNQEKEDDPGPLSDGMYDSKEYPIKKDGHWFFHIKLQDENGRWGSITHYRVNADNTPPEEFQIEKVQEKGDWPILKFETTDSLSGVDRYELIIDDLQAEPTILLADDASFKVKDAGIGKHTAIVKAFDRANNQTSATIDFTVDAIAAPKIENHTKDIEPGKDFFISGTSTPKAEISISIQKEGEDKEREFSTKSDEQGNWFLVVEELESGDYTAWAKAVNEKGLESRESPRINFSISQPTVTKVGSFVIDYFTILVSLLFMVILVIIMIVFLARIIRNKLKKETTEVEEVLGKNLSNAKSMIDMEINSLNMPKTEKERLKKELAKKIDEAEGGILKEVKDLKKILRY